MMTYCHAAVLFAALLDLPPVLLLLSFLLLYLCLCCLLQRLALLFVDHFGSCNEQIDEGFAEDDLETNLQRDKYARLCNSVNQLVDQLTPSTPDFQLREACDQLVRLTCFFSNGRGLNHDLRA